VKTKIGPALYFARTNPGFVILQNRSVLSAAAYQPRGAGDAGLLQTINAELKIAPMPELIIVLDVPLELAVARISGEGGLSPLERPDRLDAVRKRYQRLCELLPVCRRIDGVGVAQSVASRIYDAFCVARDLNTC
jgi:thymidylate kinase